MATSWSTETDEKVNHTKLYRLLYDGGTIAMRTVFDGIYPPESLADVLNILKTNLQSLKKPAGEPPYKRLRSGQLEILNQDQWDLLYPPSGAIPKSDDFDITLLFVLLRNICDLKKPATGWDALPPSTDTSPEANLVRIKCYRNKVIAHSSKTGVDGTLFETYWSEISEALISLELKQDDINELKSSPLGTKDYKQLVDYWALSDTEIKHQHEAIKTGISEIKSELSDIKSRMPRTQVESEISKLAYVDFTSLIERSCNSYHQSTRQWILNQVAETIQKSSDGCSVVLIRAGPGMGKSIVAAKICDIYQKGGFLGGCHFFQHSNSERNNPRKMLQSIARQLCNSLTGYQAALETKLKTLQGRNISDLNCGELFGVLFEEPLSQICIDDNVVIVIDALDECASEFKEEIEDALKRNLSDLPSWIQFVITTRPLPSCCNLSPVVQIEIDPSDSKNVDDLKEFFTFKLSERNVKHLIINKLMEISDGLFLVAHFVLKILEKHGNESEADVLECFPHGISSVYKYYFTRIHELIKPYINSSQRKDESFFNMLKAVVATKSPIPKEMFYNILCLKSEEEFEGAEKMKRNEAVHMLHTIFPVENDHVSVFHKTVTDWLNLDGEYEHKYSVSASNGCEVLAQKSLDALKAFKKAVQEGGKPFDQPFVLSHSERFALLQVGIEYIHQSSKLIQSVKDEIIKDFIIVAAILANCSHDFDWLPLLCGVDIDVLKRVYLCIRSYGSSISIMPKISFGHCLSSVGGVCFSEDILPPEQKQKLLSLYNEYKLPHYSVHPIVSSPPSAFIQPQSSSSSLDLFEITNGFIAVNFDPDAEPPASTVLNIKYDGSFGEHKTFSSGRVRGVSPDNKFLIITKTNSSKLELLDVTTLEKKQEYNCPISCVDSCHTFGDEQSWYIVMKAQIDPKIHILDGLNGKLHNPIEVGKDDEIKDVSQCGQILISYNDHGDTLTISLKTIHVMNREEKIYCDLYDDDEGLEINLSKNSKFSDDGQYFALLCKPFGRKVHIFHTNHSTFYKIVELPMNCLLICEAEIVFLSCSCLVFRYISSNNYSILMFFDLLNNKVIYSASMSLTKESQLLVPQHTDKSIPRILFALNGNGLVKYEFHNLE